MSAEAVQASPAAFKKALILRALGAELSHHLEYDPVDERAQESAYHRNGNRTKTVHTEDGPLRIEVPRDRAVSIEPMLIGKHKRRFKGFNDMILAMHARSTTVREIPTFLAEQYGTKASPEFISTVTGEVWCEVRARQSPPLEPMYPAGVLRPCA